VRGFGSKPQFVTGTSSREACGIPKAEQRSNRAERYLAVTRCSPIGGRSLNQHGDTAFGPPIDLKAGWTDAMRELTRGSLEAGARDAHRDGNSSPKRRESYFLPAATRLAVTNLRVFPCIPGGKTPLSVHGFKDATTSGWQIARWADRWPDANIAIATGGLGVDVVDVDAHVNGSGFSALEQARRAGLVEGWALVVRTPSGGLHFYYPARPERPQRSWSAGEAHIDFRGTGGYVLAPPSTVSQSDGTRGAYRVIAVGRDPRPVDAVALKRFLRPQQTRSVGVDLTGFVRHPQDAQRIARWMAGRPEGSRNGSLFWAACRYVDQGLPEHEAQRVLVDAALKAGLTQVEATATIGSAYRHAMPPSSGGHGRGLQW
jgi:hypothetical protein